MKGEATQFCLIDGMHVSECPHVACEACGSTRGVCGGCFKCSEHHSDYNECADWLIGVEASFYWLEDEGVDGKKECR